MSHPITITSINQSHDILLFGSVSVREGTQPTVSANPLPAGGSSSVTADQKGNFQAGPVGQFQWTNVASQSQYAAVSYNHPAGPGQTSVTVTCTSQYQASDDDETWVQSYTYTDDSLEQHSAVLTLYFRNTPQ
jgi:hypothetical protein